MSDVVTAFLRNRGELLLVRRSDEVGTYAGHWGGISGYVEPETDDPLEDAHREIREETGLSPDGDATLVRRGEPLDVTDGDREWTVHPFLFDTETREVSANEELADWEWLPAPTMRERQTVPSLWATYQRVAPSVESIAGDATHGAAWLSLRALEVLRDRAAVAAEHPQRGWDDVATVAHDLLNARPSMAVLSNRVNRAMAVACGIDTEDNSPTNPTRTPAAVVASAQETLAKAVDADEEAAATAADRLATTVDTDEPLVATLSRSGTVYAALTAAQPAVLVGESRPAREGVETADRLSAAGLDVTLATDAALAWAFDERSDVPTPDAVLVGADTVLPDGSAINKVGTRALAQGARQEGLPVYVVAASDKISPSTAVHTEFGERSALYTPAGDASDGVEVWNPIFDRTPADCVSGVVTERGVLDAEEIGNIAEQHRTQAEWTDV